jgi:hypothetical protein
MNIYAKSIERAAALNLEFWSDLGPKNPSKERRVKLSVSLTATEPILLATMADSLVRWAYVEENGTIGMLFGPDFVTLSGGIDSVVASATDSFNAPVLVTTPLSNFGPTVMALLSKTDAQAGSFPFAPEPLPETIPPPANLGADELQGHSLTELGFANVTGNDTPRFTFLPKILPVPPGYRIPINHRIEDDLPAITDPDANPYWEPFAIWCKGIRHMFSLNNGLPADAPNSVLFSAIAFDELEHFGPGHHPRSNAFQLELDALPRLSPIMLTYHQHWDEMKKIWLSLWFQSLPADPGTPPTTGGTPGSFGNSGATPEQLGIAIAAAIKDAPSSKDKANTKVVEETKIFYSLLFARNHCPSDADPPTLRPAALSSEFVAFLDAPLKSRAKKLQALFRTHLGKVLVSDRTFERNSTWSDNELDSPFATALHEASWLPSPLNRDRRSITSKLSSVHFLTVDQKRSDFTSRAAQEDTHHLQAMADEDKSRMSAKLTTLYHGGLQTQPDHVRQCIYKLFVLGSFITKDFEASSLWSDLKKYLDELDTLDGRYWLETQSVFPHVAHALIMDIQHMLGRYVAIADCLDHQTRLLNKQVVDGGPLSTATAFCQNFSNQVARAVQMQALDSYVSPPQTYQLFFSAQAPADMTNKRGAGKNDDGHKASTSKKQKSDTGSTDNKKKKGLFVWSGPDGKITQCESTFEHHVTKQKDRLCLNHCFLGRACNWDKCKFTHLPLWGKVQVSDQASLITYVEANEHVGFAPGMGPSPGTPT